jgi:hypothetical protein
MTDPGRHGAEIAGLPTEMGPLNGVIQGLLVHADWLASYGLDWREAPLPERVVRNGDIAMLNRLALIPDQTIVEGVSYWLG